MGRTYHQHCSLARALDLVGERWTLLVVRDLLPGPRRYGELLEGLPGIGTNLLAARLKELGELGLIERTSSEGRGSAYALTEAGRELEAALVPLARFGLRYLEAPGDAHWSPRWTPLALRARFDPEAAKGLTEAWEFHVDDEVFHARLVRGKLTTALGPARQPAFVLRAPARRFLELGEGRLDPARLPRDVQLEGDPEALARCARVFPAPPGT